MDFGLSVDQRETLRRILDTQSARIERVAVFGSRAQGRERPNSDLDLVIYGNADEATCDRLWTLFQESALPFSVDVQCYAAIRHPPLQAHIDAAARLLFVRAETGLKLVDHPAVR